MAQEFQLLFFRESGQRQLAGRGQLGELACASHSPFWLFPAGPRGLRFSCKKRSERRWCPGRLADGAAALGQATLRGTRLEILQKSDRPVAESAAPCQS